MVGGASDTEKPKDLMGEMNKYNKYEIRTEIARDQKISTDRLDKKQNLILTQIYSIGQRS